ncbi:hypothetical protein Bcell_2195 [Evansella cellulosilytica DSM 2522]|uniref:Uncharacterized protein n=1 Tax=Evansella cellulosilytica (strain ATCC 21833 / DSM 2522 / FERM P-1141 / JCM 9156 / N-4) TaxID=649639 RepID=E6U277_EVAC2|nr:hypothetical protein Bcell_2195 [Evansella cellulosilytica DSM 2522]
MKHVVMIFILFILNLRIKTLYKFKSNLPTLLYGVFVNFIYYILCNHHLLWEFTSPQLKVKTLRKMHIFLSTPMIILLFLTNMPKKMSMRILHVMKFTIASTIFEWFALRKLNMIVFQHGWTILWSGIVYLKMFVYCYLFTKNRIITGFFSIMSVCFFLFQFRVPLNVNDIGRNIRHVSDQLK